MIPYNAVAAVVGVSLALFLATTFNGFNFFHNQTNAFANWDTMSLASSTRVARESNDFLKTIQESLKQSVESYNPVTGTVTASLNNDRLNAVHDYATRLDMSNDDALTNTIRFGLNPYINDQGNPQQSYYEDYHAQLIHSDYLPPKISPNDEAYASTLLVEAERSRARIMNYSDDITTLISQSGKLRISSTLLGQMLNDDSAYNLVSANPDLFGLEISNSGLDMANLPNGLAIDIKVRNANESELGDADAEDLFLQRYATAQLRLDETIIEVPPIAVAPPAAPAIPPASPNPITPPPTVASSGGGVNTRSRDQLDLILNLIPSDNFRGSGRGRRGIYYNSSQPISQSNPLQIYNIAKKSFTSVYIGDDGYLNISTGKRPKRSTGPRQVNNSKFDPKNLDLTDSATLTIYSDEESLPVKEHSKLEIDTLPRSRKNYAVVKQTFSVNGMTIPKGFIVVGTKKPGLSKKLRPQIRDMENFRVYNTDGALVSIFGERARKKINCRGGKTSNCFDFNDFYTERGTRDSSGTKVGANISIQDLFPGQDANTANRNWINIQSDLATNTQLNINAAREPWHQRIFKNLNKDEKTYISHVHKFETKARLAEIFGLSNVKHKDGTARGLHESRMNALYDFTGAKVQIWKLENKLANASNSQDESYDDIEKLLKQAKGNKNDKKTKYNNALREYNDYLRTGKISTKQDRTTIAISKPKVKPTVNNTNNSKGNGNKKKGKKKSKKKKKNKKSKVKKAPPPPRVVTPAPKPKPKPKPKPRPKPKPKKKNKNKKKR